MRAFLVKLPSSVRYWTVVDDGYRVVRVADEYLQHLRLGRDAAESTTKSYADALALYLRWCDQGSRDWRTAAERLGGFITWLRHTTGDPDAPLAGPGIADVRGAGRINRVLSAVRGFLRHRVVTGEVPAAVLAMLYDITDDRHLPAEVRGEAAGLQYAARPRHRLSETETEMDRAGDAEVLGLLRACRSARDRFIVMAMARAGLRSGEVTGVIGQQDRVRARYPDTPAAELALFPRSTRNREGKRDLPDRDALRSRSDPWPSAGALPQ